MRLSVDDLRGPDVDKLRLAQRAVVTLDGVKVERCTLADEEAGYVEQYVEKVPPGSTEWPTERLHGKVQIIDPEAQT